MKLDLIESLNKTGIFTKCKQVIRDKLEIEVGCDGVLTLSSTNFEGARKQQAFKSVNGIVTLNDYDISQGTNSVSFTRSDGVVFECGEIHRNSRFIHTKSSTEELIVSLALAHFEQEKKIEELSEKIEKIASRYGISII
jgi:predicted small metal-binding protein